MTLHLNPDVLDTGSPPIPEALGWLSAFTERGQGNPIKLSQAAPGILPPASFRSALALAAASAEAQCYGDIMGDEALRDVLATETNTIYGSKLTPDQVAITPGCNQAFVSLLMVLAQAGDNILVPVPWYFNHAMACQMLGITARALITDAALGFVPDPHDAEALIDKRTRAIVLVTPNNPTGAVYPPETIAAFAALAVKHGLMLIIDETYRDFLPDGMVQPHGALGDASVNGHVASLYSFSKSFAIPGHRLGAILAPQPLMPQLGKVLDTLQISPVRTAQIALAQEWESLTLWRQDNRREINTRARAFRTLMAKVPNFRIERIGAYFAYVRHLFIGKSATEVARALATNTGVLVLPGSYFGPEQEQHLRFAFANADEALLQDAVRRLHSLS
jgi:aspartate/methionine/tyrosine aminotransferase